MVAIVADIFGSMLKGERAAREDNWDDLLKYEQVESDRTRNDKDNLSLLGGLYDFSGNRAIEQNKANASMRQDALGDFAFVGDYADQGVKNDVSGAKYAATQYLTDNGILPDYYTNTALANAERGIANSRISRGTTAVTVDNAPGALGALDAQQKAANQVNTYTAGNALPNAVGQQGVTAATLTANEKGALLSAGQSDNMITLLPDSFTAQKSALGATTATNNNVIAAAPAILDSTIAGAKYSTTASNIAKDNIVADDELTDLTRGQRIEAIKTLPQEQKQAKYMNAQNRIGAVLQNKALVQQQIANEQAKGGAANQALINQWATQLSAYDAQLAAESTYISDLGYQPPTLAPATVTAPTAPTTDVVTNPVAPGVPVAPTAPVAQSPNAPLIDTSNTAPVAPVAPAINPAQDMLQNLPTTQSEMQAAKNNYTVISRSVGGDGVVYETILLPNGMKRVIESPDHTIYRQNRDAKNKEAAKAEREQQMKNADLTVFGNYAGL